MISRLIPLLDFDNKSCNVYLAKYITIYIFSYVGPHVMYFNIEEYMIFIEHRFFGASLTKINTLSVLHMPWGRTQKTGALAESALQDACHCRPKK